MVKGLPLQWGLFGRQKPREYGKMEYEPLNGEPRENEMDMPGLEDLPIKEALGRYGPRHRETHPGLCPQNGRLLKIQKLLPEIKHEIEAEKDKNVERGTIKERDQTAHGSERIEITEDGGNIQTEKPAVGDPQ